MKSRRRGFWVKKSAKTSYFRIASLIRHVQALSRYKEPGLRAAPPPDTAFIGNHREKPPGSRSNARKKDAIRTEKQRNVVVTAEYR